MKGKNVFEKLNQARENLLSAKMKKSGKNKFAGYSYFELQDFLNPVTAIFKELGLCAVVSFGETLATMTIINVENTEEKIVFTSPMGGAALKGCHEIQNVGACETYNRRYLYMTALEIVEHDALDSSKPIPGKVEKKHNKTVKDAGIMEKYIESIEKNQTIKEMDDWTKRMTPHVDQLSKELQGQVWGHYNDWRATLEY